MVKVHKLTLNAAESQDRTQVRWKGESMINYWLSILAYNSAALYQLWGYDLVTS